MSTELPYELQPDWELSWDMLCWGKYHYPNDEEPHYQYYFCWANWLSKGYRYWGIQKMFYDQPHRSFGLWFINFSWSTQWTKWPKDGEA